MKYLLIFIVLDLGTAFYIHEKQPALWDRLMEAAGRAQLVARQVAQQSETGLASALARPPADEPAAVPESAPEAPPPSAPEYITPATTTFVSTSHVKAVAQSDVPEYGGKAFAPPVTLPAQPSWTWATVDGKHVYKNVIVCKVEADCVTILDDDGGSRVDIANLPPDIQQQLNYDPNLAAQAAEARQEQEQSSQAALAAERQQTADIAQKNWASAEANDDAIVKDAAKKKSQEDAQARVIEAQAEIDDLKDDMRSLSKEVTVDPLTGQMMGSPFWLQKYKDDQEKITELEQTVRSGGK
jgi:hypothetical protein